MTQCIQPFLYEPWTVNEFTMRKWNLGFHTAIFIVAEFIKCVCVCVSTDQIRSFALTSWLVHVRIFECEHHKISNIELYLHFHSFDFENRSKAIHSLLHIMMYTFHLPLFTGDRKNNKNGEYCVHSNDFHSANVVLLQLLSIGNVFHLFSLSGVLCGREEQNFFRLFFLLFLFSS